MDFYKGLSKNIDIFFIFGKRIDESNKGKDRKGSIDSIRPFGRINYLCLYLIDQFHY